MPALFSGYIGGQLKRMHKDENEGNVISKKIKVDVCDVDPLDIGNFVGTTHEINDDTKHNIIKNHWHPHSTFNFPFREFGADPKKPIVVDFPFNGSSAGPGCVTLNFMMEHFAFVVCYLERKQDIMEQS
ncbi:Hypothetical predicted protein [Paramuricea clavata]|uniref:Uncharacterized protein n=1 Tax=Paramuricea clavata TaxID=317549 RepID=A0A7D9M089_PARCT|nr:Hypothetical predicted protein [Paramuricea clavata]